MTQLTYYLAVDLTNPICSAPVRTGLVNRGQCCFANAVYDMAFAPSICSMSHKPTTHNVFVGVDYNV
jgi:hypothetical protein